MFVVLEMEPQINGHLVKMFLYDRQIDKLLFKTEYILK